MRYLLIASGMALGLALQPVQAAEDNGANPQATHPKETLHAPTNRIGEMVPTMTAPDEANKQGKTDASGHQAETVHPPTNRVGEAVPKMKSAENKDDAKKSKTYYYGNDAKKRSAD